MTSSGFLTEQLPLMTRLNSQSEFIIKVEYSSPKNVTNQVRNQRRNLRKQCTQKSWGSASDERLFSSTEQQLKRKNLAKRRDQGIVRRAKLEYNESQKRISALLKHEMRGVRRLESKNFKERQQRFVQILQVVSSVLHFRSNLTNRKLLNEQHRNAGVIQQSFRKYIRRRDQVRVDHVKQILGMRVVLVIANLRAKVKRTSARMLTKFVLAIPACTKALVALRLLRMRSIRIQRWWRSHLECKIARIRSLLRMWSAIEHEYNKEVKKLIRKVPPLHTIQEVPSSGSGGGYAAPQVQQQRKKKKLKSVRRLVKEAKKTYGDTTHLGMKQLKHTKSKELLDLDSLMHVIKPAIQESQQWLDEKFFFVGAKNMLISIDKNKGKKKQRALIKNKKTGTENNGKKQHKALANVHRAWDSWRYTLRKYESVDLGLGVVPPCQIPFDVRIHKIKYMLERERKLFVVKSVRRTTSKYYSSYLDGTLSDKEEDEEDEEDAESFDKPLVSMHTIKHMLDGKLGIVELYSRQKNKTFKVYTAHRFSHLHFKKEIFKTALGMSVA